MFVNRFIYLISNICNYHIITNLMISEQCDKYQKWQNTQTILWNANHESTLPFSTFEQTFFLFNIFFILCNIIFSPKPFAETIAIHIFVQTKTIAIQIFGQLNKRKLSDITSRLLNEALHLRKTWNNWRFMTYAKNSFIWKISIKLFISGLLFMFLFIFSLFTKLSLKLLRSKINVD